MTVAKTIQPWQIKKLWAISRALGMDKDDLYALAGVESLHELDIRQANEVIARLSEMQGSYSPPKKSKKQHSEVAGMATEGQQRKVWALMYQLQGLDKIPSTTPLGDRLCGIIKKELNTMALPEKPFIWLDFKAANKLIEVLKKYIDSAAKKGGGSS